MSTTNNLVNALLSFRAQGAKNLPVEVEKIDVP